ncbi:MULTISPECIES: hypothetical protein [Streptomyces]|uniref:DUF3558 domain-containing protein n=2 Tax=Streptomyces venezuelae TaxID=54571 RepID=F2RB15_STRVP|nr:hypothetical protein [Streptomyces venezuelae]APE24745.1 hypothetical protein vnz_29405 [Streptomyces venezuelae]QES02094.1 hypothetical protein DEJ43_29875 [Streptomyces venezuelae ATCC 10712]CCA59234.1 hypothetical protein SVEN_5948 [Streptomyces venezuelae ATCC 10712]
MRTGVRGIVVAAAMVAALAGCGGGDGTDPAGGAAGAAGATGAPGAADGAGAGGKEQSQPASLDATGLLKALPVSAEFTDGTYTGGDPEVVPEAAAAKFCADNLEGVDCAGVKSGSIKDLVLAGNSSDDQATFTLYTFGTEAEATAVLKAVEKKRQAPQGEGGPFTPVKVESGGADESFAVERDDYVGVYMRVGSVVSYVSTGDFGRERAERAAQVQIGRLKLVLGGGDPDA